MPRWVQYRTIPALPKSGIINIPQIIAGKRNRKEHCQIRFMKSVLSYYHKKLTMKNKRIIGETSWRIQT